MIDFLFTESRVVCTENVHRQQIEYPAEQGGAEDDICTDDERDDDLEN